MVAVGPRPGGFHAEGSLQLICRGLGAGTSLWDHGVDEQGQSSWGCMFLRVMWAGKMVVVPGQEVGWKDGLYPSGNPSSLAWEGWKGLSPGAYWKPLKPAESLTWFCICYSHLCFLLSFSFFFFPPPFIFISS